MDYTSQEKLQQMSSDEIDEEYKKANRRVTEVEAELQAREDDAYNMKFGR